MDHMVTNFNKTVGIVCTACLSMTLQFGAHAQTPTSPISSPNQVTKPNSSDSQSNTDLNKVALASETPAKAINDAKGYSSREAEISEPKIKPQNPVQSFKVSANESKLDARVFSMPDEDLGEPMTFQATAYSLKGRTRSGAGVRRGVVAADPRVLPLGSVVQIKAGKYTGVYTVHDTGGKIKGNIIDVWVPDKHEARQFGRRKIQLQVLKLGASKSRKR
ncbi:MAG: 3D domain-containing protein [Acidobacteria bacterium]|nr:3D domain-containing protein [Acidobacteriota bacterium]